MEFGPRALGNRSILAHPGDAGMKERLNLIIKHREAFRPFGASVLREHMAEFFEQDWASPFMLFITRVRADKIDAIPAVTHVNGSSRIQTVTPQDNGIYYELIRAFHERSGLPMVLNTSFNDSEPIVHTPEEAYRCFEESDMDCLALGSYLVER